MNAFAFHRPADVAAAVQACTTRPDARYLGGGQTLLGAMKLGLASPTDLIHVARLAPLQGCTLASAAGGGNVVRIGAAETHAAVAASALVREQIPALALLAAQIGDPAVRSQGTLGGSLANNDPAACYPAAVLGLDATVHTDRRAIAADDFFLGLYATALAPGELITAVSFPVPQKAGWSKFKQPASRFALVGVFASRAASGAVRVAVTGAGPVVFRARALETALAARWSPDRCAAIAHAADGLISDLHASAAYRAALIPVLAARAVGSAG